MRLAGGRGCDEKGAVCAPDGRALTNSPGVTIGGPARIRVEGGRAREGRDASVDFAVSLNRAAAHAVSVDYATADGTAAAGPDYTATSGTLTFAPGETEKTVAVALLDDAVDEGKERFTLVLSNPRGAFLRAMHRKAVGVIVNSDPLQAMWLARFGRMVASDAVASVTHSVGEGTARDAGWRYALGSTATMALPYARLALSDRVSVWGMAGTGSGTLSLDLDGSVPQSYRTDLAMTLAAVGVRGDLVMLRSVARW